MFRIKAVLLLLYFQRILNIFFFFKITVSTKYSMLIIITQYMIPEGSCDAEDWSIDVENSALPSRE